MTIRFKYRDQYDDKADAIAREATNIDSRGHESLTQQHFQADCDLNVVMKRYGMEDGSIPVVNISDQIQDFTDAPDFRAALDQFHHAQEQFMSLPAKIRAKFNNNMGQMHDWVLDPDNYDEAVKLGFIQKPAPAPPVPPVAAPPVPAPTP